MSILRTATLVGFLAASVSAHGHVTAAIADGTFYGGYFPSMQFHNPPAACVAWSLPDNWSNGFVDPTNYSTPDIICHYNATPGSGSAKVAAGGVVELQWGNWPEGHHGPVIDYLAKCPGSCSDVDKTQLEFFKIDEAGFAHNDTLPNGSWATSTLIENNNSWVVTIPKDIAPGNYVLRHEIIALHVAGDLNGAQNYPQCINLEITSDGTNNPPGVLGADLYKPTDPGLLINIWTSQIQTYTIPGPPLYSEAISMSQAQLPIKQYATTTYGSTTSGFPLAKDYLATATSTPTLSMTTTTTTSSSLNAATPTPSFSYDPSSSSTPTTSFSSFSSADAATPSKSDSDSGTHTEMPTPSSQPITSQVAVIASAVPSVYLTSSIIAPLPSATTSSTATEYHWGDQPSKPLPAGYTLKDLLEWTAYTVKMSWNKEDRVHQRDFAAVGAL